MGTENRENHEKNDVIEKQNELKQWIKKIDLTQNKFAEKYYTATNDIDNNKEKSEFIEKFKKQLQRRSTKVEILETYLQFLYQTDEFRKSQTIKPQNTSANEFDKRFNEKIKKMSKALNGALRELESFEDSDGCDEW